MQLITQGNIIVRIFYFLVPFELFPANYSRKLDYLKRRGSKVHPCPVPPQIMSKGDEAERLFQQLLTEAAKPESAGVELPSQLIVPEPGFCMKTVKIPEGAEASYDGRGWPLGAEKAFVNVCFSSKLPDPPDISEEKLVEILQVTEDAPGAESFSVPMSLGEPHAELDKNGKGCTVYDVVISHGFFEKIKEKELFMSFFTTVALEGIEDKYKVNLARDVKLLKNKKFMGTLPEHNVRTKSKPRIQEVQRLMKELELRDGGKQIEEAQKIVEMPASTTASTPSTEPSYTIRRDPIEGHPQFLVVEVLLPGVVSAKSLSLSLNEDTLSLSSRSGLYRLHVACLPFDVEPEDSVAEFNKISQVLTVTLPVS